MRFRRRPDSRCEGVLIPTDVFTGETIDWDDELNPHATHGAHQGIHQSGSCSLPSSTQVKTSSTTSRSLARSTIPTLSLLASPTTPVAPRGLTERLTPPSALTTNVRVLCGVAFGVARIGVVVRCGCGAVAALGLEGVGGRGCGCCASAGSCGWRGRGLGGRRGRCWPTRIVVAARSAPRSGSWECQPELAPGCSSDLAPLG